MFSSLSLSSLPLSSLSLSSLPLSWLALSWLALSLLDFFAGLLTSFKTQVSGINLIESKSR